MANLTPKFSLKTMLATVTVLTILIAYVVNDRKWRRDHAAVLRRLEEANRQLELADRIWTPKHAPTQIVATSPDGRAAYLSLMALHKDRAPQENRRMLQYEGFGSVLSKYLRTIDGRDLYEVCIAPGRSMAYEESGKTPGVVVKYVSFEGQRMVLWDEGGYRVEMECDTLPGRHEVFPVIESLIDSSLIESSASSEIE